MADNKNISEFKAETEDAFQKAWHSEKGGDSNWENYLQTYGVESLTDSEKQMLLNSEIKIAKGAFPLELRRVYDKIIEKFSTRGDAELMNVIRDFKMDEKIMEYYRKIKPFSGMNDIFGNASATQDKYSAGMQKAKHHTIKCKNCASPRLEEMQYDICLFCGSKLFETA
ncbi:MAG: hypothetical protein ABI528_09785 [bacterium]